MSSIVDTDRPRGLVPGSGEWLKEVEGPRIIKRLSEEVHAGKVGEMTPTQARCAALLIDRVMPALSAVHHTMETDLSRLTKEELLAELRRLTSEDAEEVQVIEHAQQQAK